MFLNFKSKTYVLNLLGKTNTLYKTYASCNTKQWSSMIWSEIEEPLKQNLCCCTCFFVGELFPPSQDASHLKNKEIHCFTELDKYCSSNM